jgi:hypothetical protein
MRKIFPMASSIRTSIAIYLLFLILLALTASCFNPFSPSVIGPSLLKPIAARIDPDSVLYNFKYAYENRDSIVYEDCLDEDFIYTYWDQSDVQGIVETELLRGEDLRVTSALFRFFDDISLDKWEVEPAPDSLDSVTGEIWKARVVRYDLLVWDTDGDYGYDSFSASGSAEFLFRQSKTDNLWRIVRWIDRTT